MCVDLFESYFAAINYMSYKMVFYINMFSLVVITHISSQMNNTLIVT